MKFYQNFKRNISDFNFWFLFRASLDFFFFAYIFYLLSVVISLI